MRVVAAFVIGLVLGAVGLYVHLLQTHRAVAASAGAPRLPAVTLDTAAPVAGSADRVRRSPPAGSLTEAPLGLPIDGLTARDLRDTFEEGRTGHRHEAIDIMQPRGTPVLAVVDGPIAKLFFSKQGGITVYQFDNAGQYCYYYAHLDRYAERLKEGQSLRRGDVIAYVGSTGDAQANAPHLHFTIFKLGPEKHWWQGTAINPYPVLASQ